jgi:hypothetical protein
MITTIDRILGFYIEQISDPLYQTNLDQSSQENEMKHAESSCMSFQKKIVHAITKDFLDIKHDGY